MHANRVADDVVLPLRSVLAERALEALLFETIFFNMAVHGQSVRVDASAVWALGSAGVVDGRDWIHADAVRVTLDCCFNDWRFGVQRHLLRVEDFSEDLERVALACKKRMKKTC